MSESVPTESRPLDSQTCLINRESLKRRILTDPDLPVEAGGMTTLENPPDLTNPEIREAYEVGMSLGVKLGRMNPKEPAAISDDTPGIADIRKLIELYKDCNPGYSADAYFAQVVERAEAYAASSVLLPTTNLEPCPECKGKGWTIFGDAKRQTCDACRGKGQIRAASSVLLPVRPTLPKRAENMEGLIGAVWSAHDEWKRLDARDQLSGECDYAEWLADAVLNHLRNGLPVGRQLEPKWERQESCPECDGDGCPACCKNCEKLLAGLPVGESTREK